MSKTKVKPSSIEQDSTNRFQTDAEKTVWNAAQSASAVSSTVSAAVVAERTAPATLDAKTLTSPIITSAILNGGYTEAVFAVTSTTPALSPTNGSIQTWSLTANSTPTAGTWAAGQSMIIMITAGAFTVTWPSVVWSKVGGSGVAPGLTATGQTCVILWKVGSTIYGSLLGSV